MRSDPMLNGLPGRELGQGLLEAEPGAYNYGKGVEQRVDVLLSIALIT